LSPKNLAIIIKKKHPELECHFSSHNIELKQEQPVPSLHSFPQELRETKKKPKKVRTFPKK
jgi:hypothetical protein